MRKSVLTTLAGLLFWGSSKMQAQTTPYLYANQVTNCIARWTFDGAGNILTDSSGTGNNGTLQNTTSNFGWRGIAGQAAKFNGYSSKGDVPSSTSLKVTNATIVALVKFNGFYAGPCQGNNIISKGADNVVGNYCLRLADSDYPLDPSCNNFYPDQETFQTIFGTDNNIMTPKPIVGAEKWYFLAVTYQDGVEKRMFQVEMDTTNYAPPTQTIMNVNESSVTIGANNTAVNIGYLNVPNYPYWLNGDLDELVIFNRVLDEKELGTVYDFLWNKGTGNTTSVRNAEIAKNVSFQKQGSQFVFAVKNGKAYDAVLVDLLGRSLKTFKMTDNYTLDLGSYAKQMFILTLYNNTSKETLKLQN